MSTAPSPRRATNIFLDSADADLATEPVPPTRIRGSWVQDLIQLLRDHGYDAVERSAIVYHAVNFGSVACCPGFRREEDRDAVETIIPDDDSWNRDLIGDDFPVPTRFRQVDLLLQSRGYSPADRIAAVTAVASARTAQCTRAVRNEDRDDVEVLLSQDPAWNEDRWDGDWYELGPEAPEPTYAVECAGQRRGGLTIDRAAELAVYERDRDRTARVVNQRSGMTVELTGAGA